MEQVEDAFDRYRDFMQALNTRRTRERRVGTEHYINGDAYFEWDIPSTILGQKYDLRLRGKVVDPLRDAMFGLPIAFEVAGVELSCRGHRQDELVLVHQVQFVKRHEEIIPSWVGLYVAADPLGGGRRLARLLLQNLLELGVEFAEGERGVANRLTLGRNGGAEGMIQRCTQVVDRIADHSGQDHRKGPLERHQHGEAIDFEIKLLDNAIWTSAQKRGDLELGCGGVRLCPLDL